MPSTERYIVLTDTIIDREKIVMVLRLDGGTVRIVFEHGSQEFDGDDAQLLWRSFDPQKNWHE